MKHILCLCILLLFPLLVVRGQDQVAASIQTAQDQVDAALVESGLQQEWAKRNRKRQGRITGDAIFYITTDESGKVVRVELALSKNIDQDILERVSAIVEQLHVDPYLDETLVYSIHWTYERRHWIANPVVRAGALAVGVILVVGLVR